MSVDLHTLDVLEMGASLDQALLFHLEARVFPSRTFMFDTAKAAIEACNQGNPDALIHLPADVTFRGQPEAPAYEIINHLNLSAFLVD